MAERRGRVEDLGRRHRDPGLAERVDEAQQRRQQERRVAGRHPIHHCGVNVTSVRDTDGSVAMRTLTLTMDDR